MGQVEPAADNSDIDAWWAGIDDAQHEAWFDAYLHGVSPGLAARVPTEKCGCHHTAWIWKSVETHDWIMAGLMRGFIRERGILMAGHVTLWSDKLHELVNSGHVEVIPPLDRRQGMYRQPSHGF